MERTMIHTPAGVRDLYGMELEKKKEIAARIQKRFAGYGYRQIATPAFEFFDIFSKEVGTTPSKDLFKFFDKEGNTLVLRPDFTPSAARCAVKYFLEETRHPVRLCYEGNAFTNTLELQGKLKETTQSGAELIGDTSVDADAEMLALVIETLTDLGFHDFTVSVGEMDFFKGICEEAGVDEDTIAELREQISVKNYYAAEELLREKGLHSEYGDLLLNAGDICSIEELQELCGKVGNPRSSAAIERLITIYDLMSQRGLERFISFDLGMLSKFHYYTGMIFKAYTYGVGDAIVKGGRYDSLLSHFGKAAGAVGCVFLVDDIMSALAAQNAEPEIQLPSPVWIVYDDVHRKEAFAEMKKLRDNGKIAVGCFAETKEQVAMYETTAGEEGAVAVMYVD